MISFIQKWFETLSPKWRYVVFQGAFVPLTPDLAAGPPLLVQAIKDASLGDFLQSVFNIAISVGAILAVLEIGFAGFQYMTTDAVGTKGSAVKRIQDAVLGLLMLLAIVIILGRINPDLLKMKFDLGGGASGGTTQKIDPFTGQPI